MSTRSGPSILTCRQISLNCRYEKTGVLIPERTNGGYPAYTEADITRVAQINAMISAGPGTTTITRHLDCARGADHGTSPDMCPDLRPELGSIARCLATKEAELRETQRRLSEIAPADSA